MSGFQRIKLIAMREVMTRFRMRAYRITLIVQVVIALLAGLSPIALSYFAGGSSGNEVLVVDSTELGFADVLQRHLTNDVPGMGAMTVSSFADGADAARDKVKDGDAAAAVIVTEENSTAHYEIVLKNASGLDITSQRVQSAVAASNIEFQAELAGVPADQAAQLVSAPSIVVESPEGESNSIADNFSGPVFAIVNIGLILTYTLFIVYGTWIAQGVVEEKSSRMMEIMVNAATPRDLLMGKVVGVLVAGLGQMLPMIAAAAISFALQPRIADALGVELTSTFDFDLAALSFKAVAVFLVYFIGGYSLFGAFFAAAGSMVSRQEDVNQAIAPAMVLIMVGLFISYVVMAIPNSTLSKVLFLVPLSSPFVALSRILLGDPSAGEITLSIVLLAITGVAAMLMATKVYRVGVLMYGQKAGLFQYLRLSRLQRVAR